jgi:hypothetical protein
MTCPHLEETSALFDGAHDDRTHADSCAECRAFLADAALLCDSLADLSQAPAPQPKRRVGPILVPAAVLLCIVLFLILRPAKIEESGPFAGLDGGGRAVISVKDAR